MTTNASRYEAQDKLQHNVKYRLFRYFEREWGAPVIGPPPHPSPSPPSGALGAGILGA